ncbi:MAG: SGNH/GDSL hydrolase family protein [Gemmatimonadetes bacterium]|nr:SGNH/GDSL hydrolase family protein [Gemmatimonadota bacterium]
MKERSLMNPLTRWSRRRLAPAMAGTALVAAVLLILLQLSLGAQGAATGQRWVGTWATALVARVPPPPPPPGPPAADPAPQGRGGRGGRGGAPPLNVSNQTLRQIVHTSIGGERVRVVFSNAFGTAPLPIGAAHIARREQDAALAPNTSRALTFGGQPGATIPPGAVVFSDPVDLSVPAMTDLAIDLYLPGSTESPSPVTTHNGALQASYVSTAGNHAGVNAIPVATTTQAWFFLARVEVLAPASAGAVVVLGDSISDGTASTPNTNNRWPNHLARRLAEAKMQMGVLNLGIAGNRVLGDGAGVNALARFDRDVLAQTGVTHVVVMEGINDFGIGGADGPSAAEVIAGHQQLIARARAAGLRIYAGTLTPFEGTAFPGYYSPENDGKRRTLNEWIRTGKAYDGVIDFDAAVRDQMQPARLLPAYAAADNLHLNDAGYQAMARTVDLSMFRR